MFPYNEKSGRFTRASCPQLGVNRVIFLFRKLKISSLALWVRSREALGYNTHFLYPDDGGGIEGLAQAIKRTLTVEIECERAVACIDLAKRQVTTRDGEIIGYHKLVSTMALSSLIDACAKGGDLPAEVAQARALLRSTTVSHLDVLAKGLKPRYRGTMGRVWSASLGLFS